MSQRAIRKRRHRPDYATWLAKESTSKALTARKRRLLKRATA